MKILILTHYFTPHMGGIENVSFAQAKELTKKGHQVTIITSKLSDEKEFSKVEGFRVIRINALNILENKFGIPYPFFSPKLFKVLAKKIKKTDLVHVHGHVFMPSVAASFFAKKYNKPLLVTQHNTFVNYKNPIFKFLQTLADKTLGQYTFSAANKIIAVSNKTKNYIISISPVSEKTLVQYNGINLKKFNNQKDLNLKKTLNLKNQFVCLSVRRITFKNGIDTLLETAQKLSKQNIVFLIGGKGPDLKKLEEEIKVRNLKNIKLLGFISDEDLPKYYALSDVFILPSKKGEGFPLVVLESFASSIPVIATKSGGHEEIIKNGENGYLVNVGSSTQIANKINFLYENKNLLNKMSKNSRILAEKYFSWTDNIKNLNLIYKEVLG